MSEPGPLEGIGRARSPDPSGSSWAVRLGAALRFARESARLTVREVEELLERAVPASAISAYERGIRMVPEERLALLARTYGLAADEVVARARGNEQGTRVIIDLDTLRVSSEPQLSQVVDHLLTQRQSPEGRWLKIRREDIDHAARYEDAAVLECRLRAKGILVPAPSDESAP